MTQELASLSSGEALLSALTLANRRVIDIGSGDGGMTLFMTAQGAHVVGVECGASQLARARQAPVAGDERYVEGVGQALPLPDRSADIVVFMNSLHHVPVPEQANALREAARVLVPGGLLYVAEPLAEGAGFELMRPVDDETDLRAAAYEQIMAAPALGFDLLWERRHFQPRRVASYDALKANSLSIDPGRAERFAAFDQQLRAGFERIATRLPDGGYELPNTIRAHLLRRR